MIQSNVPRCALNEMFPKVKSSSLDMLELGARMAVRKDELLAQET